MQLCSLRENLGPGELSGTKLPFAQEPTPGPRGRAKHNPVPFAAYLSALLCLCLLLGIIGYMLDLLPFLHWALNFSLDLAPGGASAWY